VIERDLVLFAAESAEGLAAYCNLCLGKLLTTGTLFDEVGPEEGGPVHLSRVRELRFATSKDLVGTCDCCDKPGKVRRRTSSGIERCLADEIAELKYLTTTLENVNGRIAKRLARGEGNATVVERNQLQFELGMSTGELLKRYTSLRPRLEALLMDSPEVPRG